MKRAYPIFLCLAICGLALKGSSQPWPDTLPTAQAAVAESVVEPSSTVTIEVATERFEETPRIEVKPNYKVGEKIEINFVGDTVTDAEASLHWTLPPTVQSEAGSSDGRRLLVWASPGLYDVKLNVSYSLDVLVPDPNDSTKTKVRRLVLPAYEYVATFKVGDVPDPKPEPDAPLTGLAALVPDRAKRVACSEFFDDLAQAASEGAFTSTSHFRAAYRKAIADAQASGDLPKGIAALDAPISTRIGTAIGLADGPLNQAALVAELKAIAKELDQ